jgi:hypothetical protein
MDLDKFLNLLAAIFGALGAVYVMLSIITMSPEVMFRQAASAWDFSASLIDALAGQQADNIAGFVFVILAFLFAAVTIAFVPEGLRVFKSMGVALAIAAVIAGGVYVALHFISQGIYKHQRLAILKIPVSQFIDGFLTRSAVNTNDVAQVPIYAKLLELDVAPGESTRSLLQRVASAVGRTLPTLDYSAVEPKEKLP